ncbi:MAG: N-acetylmuramoyl-L-alanine amidase [Lachnospiraceae bacterium]|nr:N-acetylmuramoyl-L-alanine amidase [Lachnospiraceae bacterium]
MKKIKLFAAVFIFIWLFMGFSSVSLADSFRYPLDTDGELVIVIDPGHGGKNLGADYNGFLEKEMNMTVANAMYEELTKYEGITVYMTHTSTDTDMSIQERADFAASVNADFLFCLHFNMSPDNKLFGSEVWVSAFGDENREGYRFGYVQMETMKDMGLFLRGVKTRFNERGSDYYGILRFCEEYNIPAALIEHCHIDHDTDVGFCDSEEDLIAFGVADATSVAKYFGLRSEILGVDYSSYDNMPAVNAGEVYVQADTTDPDICVIEEAYIDLDRQIIGVTVTAQDYDSPMLYYSYSIDGGITYTPYLAWPETDIMAGYSPDTFTFEIPVPDSVSPAIIVRGINQYDRYSASNLLSGFPVFVSTPEEIFNPEDDMLTEEASVSGQDVSENSPAAGFTRPEPKAPRETDTSFLDFLKLCLLAAGVLFVAMLITNLMIAKKRRQKRKPPRRR